LTGELKPREPEITEEDINKLFRIFQQLVELHGGKIWAQSNYGEGTIFMFMLPLVENKEG
jgi:signal transduction histidine kinase